MRKPHCIVVFVDNYLRTATLRKAKHNLLGYFDSIRSAEIRDTGSGTNMITLAIATSRSNVKPAADGIVADIDAAANTRIIGCRLCFAVLVIILYMYARGYIKKKIK